MAKNRLKLYDDSVYTYISHKDKNKFRKIAFKYKMTISEFNRYLIKLVISFDEKKNLKFKENLNNSNINTFLNSIRREF